MNWVDFVILALIGIPALLGLKTGLIRAVANLGGIIVGIFLASRFSGQAADLIGIVVKNEDLTGPLGFIAIMAGTLVLAWIAAAFLKRVLSLLLLGWVDKVGGAVFGVVVGSFFVSAIIFVMELSGMESAANALEASTLKPFFDLLVDLVDGLAGDLDFVSI